MGQEGEITGESKDGSLWTLLKELVHISAGEHPVRD